MSFMDDADRAAVETGDSTGGDGDAAPRRERAGGRLVLIVVLVLALLLGGGWVAAYAVAGDDVPRGASVEGVEIGGRSASDAVDTLREGLAERETQAIDVEIVGRPIGDGPGPRSRSLDPAEAGLAVDYEASVAEAGGARSWNPARLWEYFTGGEDRDAVLTIDRSAFDEATEEYAEIGEPARDGEVRFTSDAEVETVDPRVGRGVDPDQLLDAVTEAYLDEEPARVELVDVAPAIDADDVATAVAEFAEPAMSGQVRLVLGETTVRLGPRRIASVLSMAPEDGALVPRVDEAGAAALVAEEIGDGAPQDATVVIRDGAPQVVPSEQGITFDDAAIGAAIIEAAVKAPGERRAEVPAQVTDADFSTADAEALGVIEKVSEFETQYPHAEYRNVNIGRAAELVDGTLLKPGETFSLNDTVGERTAENGFTVGAVISDGIFVNDFGGGVSQMATTTFNAMFFAGLEDVEHRPHSVYISRYPEGREATVAWGSLDLRFRNDTDHGVLIDAEVTPSTPGTTGNVRVAMWSTQVWDIDETTSGRYAFTSPGTREVSASNCQPATGSSGFQVDVTRIFRRAGESEIERRENFHTVYNPAPTVRCVG